MMLEAARKLDRLGYGDSPVHRLDPRVKILAALLFAATVASFPKYALAAPAALAFAPFLLAWFGDVPFCVIGRMLLLAAPFALMVGLFNPLFDRAPMVLGHWTVAAGWISCASILLRFALSMSMVLVLVATTALPDLLRGLRSLHVPAAFVTQLQFLYRYLFLLADEGARMGRARLLRDPWRRHASVATARAMIAALLVRATDRAERVHHALQARGFRGEFPARRQAVLRPQDALFLGALASLCVAVRCAGGVL